MMNDLETYRDAGRECGLAARHNDAACIFLWTRWFRAATAIENESDRTIARQAFDEGYRAVAARGRVIFR